MHSKLIVSTVVYTSRYGSCLLLFLMGGCSADSSNSGNSIVPMVVADTFPAAPLPLGTSTVNVSVTFNEAVQGLALGTTVTVNNGATLSGLSTSDNMTYSCAINGLINHQSYTVAFTSGITDSAGTAFAGTTRSLVGGNPTINPPLPGAGAMFGGAREGMILMSDGTVFDWGSDMFGHLGDGNPTPTDEYTPVQVVGPLGVGHLESIVAIASGEPFNTALKSDGSVFTWGDNSLASELGVGPINPPASSNVPVQVHGPGDVGFLSSITAIGSRGYFALALASDTSVWAWGMNKVGQLGDGNAGVNGTTPIHVKGPGGVGFLSGAAAVTGGYDHSIALMADKTVYVWGGNDHGQLGTGNVMPSPFPTQISTANISNISQVSAGWTHSLALRSDNTVWAWGQNDHGQIGNGCQVGVNCADVSTPSQVPIANVVAVSAGDCHSAALKTDGTVWTWGCNHSNGTDPATDPVGQLGNGDMTYTDSSTPVQVHGPGNVGFLTGITVISARDYHNYALRSDGTLWSWGSNLNGQLGNGACCVPSTFPVQVKLP